MVRRQRQVGDCQARKDNAPANFACIRRIALHFIPTYSSWRNQGERFFALITGKAISRGSFTSVKQLAQRIDQFVAHCTPTASRYAGLPPFEPMSPLIACSSRPVREDLERARSAELFVIEHYRCLLNEIQLDTLPGSGKNEVRHADHRVMVDEAHAPT